MENEDLIVRKKNNIYTIRNVAVMLDKDLASLYGVSTARLNEQVKRNISRFPPKFCFQLNKSELMDWMSQNAISKSERMGIRKCPFVFTEYGAAMISSVLKSTVAVEVSIQIIQGFIDFKYASRSGEVLISRLSGIEQLLLSHDSQIQNIYQKLKDVEFPKSGIFFNDQIFDAYVFSSELIKSAGKSVVLLDNYVDEATLLQLSKRRHDGGSRFQGWMDCCLKLGRGWKWWISESVNQWISESVLGIWFGVLGFELLIIHTANPQL